MNDETEIDDWDAALEQYLADKPFGFQFTTADIRAAIPGGKEGHGLNDTLFKFKVRGRLGKPFCGGRGWLVLDPEKGALSLAAARLAAAEENCVAAERQLAIELCAVPTKLLEAEMKRRESSTDR